MKKLLILPLVMASFFAKGQTNAVDGPRFSRSLGVGLELGMTTIANEPMIAMHLGYFNDHYTFIKFRFASIVRENFEIEADGQANTPGLSEFNLMVGKHQQLGENHFLQFGGGGGLLIDIKEIDRPAIAFVEEKKFFQRNAIGLAGEIKYGFRFDRGVGVTFSVGGNLNKHRSFATVGFGMILKGGLFSED